MVKKHLGQAGSSGHTWGSGNKLGDGASSSGPVHPQQLATSFTNLDPTLQKVLGVLALYLVFVYWFR